MSDESLERQEEAALRRGRLAGSLLQGVVLGVALFFALARLFALAEGARVFRYQAF